MQVGCMQLCFVFQMSSLSSNSINYRCMSMCVCVAYSNSGWQINSSGRQKEIQKRNKGNFAKNLCTKI